jgi:hypothetical protein
VNGSGRKDGEKDGTQGRWQMAEKMEVGGYSELQPVYDRTLTSRVQR